MHNSGCLARDRDDELRFLRDQDEAVGGIVTPPSQFGPAPCRTHLTWASLIDALPSQTRNGEFFMVWPTRPNWAASAALAKAKPTGTRRSMTWRPQHRGAVLRSAGVSAAYIRSVLVCTDVGCAVLQRCGLVGNAVTRLNGSRLATPCKKRVRVIRRSSGRRPCRLCVFLSADTAPLVSPHLQIDLVWVDAKDTHVMVQCKCTP